MRFLFRPTKPYKRNQPFGANRVCIPINGGKAISCNGLKPPAGYKSVYSRMKGHNGLDLDTERGQGIYSCTDGIVFNEVTEEDRGFGLEIITKYKFHCEETGKPEHFKLSYWHNLYHLVHEDDEVKIGQLIALSDSTGKSTGHHLHLGLKPVKVTWRDGKPRRVSNILQDNGYFGAVDPEQYMSDYDSGILRGITSKIDRLVALLKLFVGKV